MNIQTVEAPLTDPLTLRSLRVWSAGDYDQIAAGFRGGAAEFVQRQQLRPGERVLDAACGSGNLTIPAAEAGARVLGVDLVPSLLADAGRFAAAGGWDVELVEGNVEDLPCDDAEFDVVLSMFGTMFAARPDRVASELGRVVRPGGRIALANWTRTGFVGGLFGIVGRYAPPPADPPSPLLWGDEGVVNERLAPYFAGISATRRMMTFRFPFGPKETARLFIAEYGPIIRAMEMMSEDARTAFTGELEARWVEANRGGDTATIVESEYLEVNAVR